MLAALLGLALVASEPAYYCNPAIHEYAQVVPGGTTVLPNGRLLTPKGTRLYAQGEDVWGSVLSPDGSTYALFHDGGFTVHRAFDTQAARGVRVARKNIAPCGAFSSDGSKLLISLGDDSAIEVLDTASWAVVQSIRGLEGGYINDLKFMKDERYAVGVDVAVQRLVVFDLLKGKIQTSLPAGREPYAVTLDAAKRRAYVANIGLFDYSVVPPVAGPDGDPRGLTRPPFGFPSREAEQGVEFEGRFVPGLGRADAPEAHSIYEYDLRRPTSPRFLKSVKSGLLIHAPSDHGKAVGGSAPNALLVHGNRLFVSNANNDTVQVFRIPGMRLERTIRLTPAPELARYRGVIPSGLALGPDGKRLYVCESGLNSVAVVDIRSGQVVGRVPTGWFPMSVQVSSDGKRLFVASQKGLGRGPQGMAHLRPASDERHGLAPMPGMATTLPVPTDAELAGWTQEVLRNNGLLPRPDVLAKREPSPVPALPGRPSDQIQHVVFITKENHTFDGIFGGLEGARSHEEYAEWGVNGWIREVRPKQRGVSIMPNHLAIARKWAISDNFYMEPVASGDGHRWLIGVYPSLWTSRLFYMGWNFRADDRTKGRLASMGSNGSQIPEDYLESGSMWEHLVRGGVPIRNYGEGFEFPGQEEPEEVGQTGSILQVNHPINQVLWDNTCWTFPVYNNEIPDLARVEWFREDLEKEFDAKGKPIPNFMNITLCNDHGASPDPNNGYPYTASYMADNDVALGRLLEYLSRRPEWKSMAVIVTQDDPGGDDDHIDRHRSFVMAAGPWAKRGYVGKTHTSIMSILRTIYLIFGLAPNNLFDAVATDLGELFTLEPDFSPYTHVLPDPKVFVPEAAYNASIDAKFRSRIHQRASIPMDHPDWIERMKPED